MSAMLHNRSVTPPSIAERDRPAFLRQFPMRERAEAQRLQRDWLRDYNRALNRAKWRK